MFFKKKKAIVCTSKIIYDQKAVGIEDKKIYNGYVKELSDSLIVVRCDDGFDHYITDITKWNFLTRNDRPELVDEKFKEFCLYKRVQRLGEQNVFETYKEIESQNIKEEKIEE